MMDRIHLALTGARLVLLVAGLSLFGTFAMLSLVSGNPFGVITNLVLWDLVAGRFMAVEHQLAMRDVTIDFPGRQLSLHVADWWEKRLHPKRAAARLSESEQLADLG